MPRFRAYYADGSTYSGDPFLAPAHGVIAIAVEDGDGVSIRKNKDHFCWRDDVGWFSCDDAGMWDYLYHYVGPKALLHGRYIRNDDYWAIVRRAVEEGLG